MTIPAPKDHHDEPWAKQAALLDSKTCMALIDAVSLIASHPDAISDGLEVELVVFTETIQRTHHGLGEYCGIWAPGTT